MTAPNVPTGTVTFLFTDIEGSTRLEEAVGTKAYAEIRERHRAILRGAFNAHTGVEQGTEGDSFFVVFSSARDAVAAAVDAQRGLAAAEWPAGSEVRVRMGLHSGEAQLAGGSLVGIDINRASRIAAVANGGQIIASEATRALAGGSLPSGVSLRDLGQHRLKDLSASEHLVQVDAEGLPAEFPPLRSLDARPNNLPTQLTTFVGREAELDEARRLLEGARLLTLTGPGGTGKTRLSLELAALVAEGFPEGVFFVPLEPIREVSLVVPSIAAALGFFETGSRSARDLLVEWLSGKRVLLVLDNFEQIVEAGPVIADLLRSVETLVAIATSRTALHIYGEQEFPVPGLPAPPDVGRLSGYERAQLPARLREVDPSLVGEYEAVRLFVARAMALSPAFRLTSDNGAAVAAICARLHGMPLAIELAAARIKLLSPDAILTRLDQQLNLLAAGSRDLPERQQTLRGAIAWSYDLLDEGGRLLFERMSVFVAGGDLNAIEAVCGPASEIGVDVLDGVSSLLDQSLARRDDSAEPRFQLIETIRDYAAERLAERGAADAIRGRFRDWLLAFVERATAQLAGEDQRMWLERLEQEHDNIRAVLDRAVSRPEPAVAIRMGFAMWRFWQKRGHLGEARRRLEAIAEAPWSRDDPVLRARLVEALGGLCWWQADLPAMKGYYDEALGIWREIGDRREIANALYNASFAYALPASVDTPDSDPDGRGLALIDEALALYRELGDDAGQGNALWAAGNRFYFRRQHLEAVDKFEQALEKFRKTDDRTMESWSLHMLGTALTRSGDIVRARAVVMEAMRKFQAAGDAAGVTMVLDDFSALAVVEGDLPRAARLRGAARNLTRETGATLATVVDDWFEAYDRPGVRSALSPEDLDRFEKEGAAMSLGDAVTYALEGTSTATGAGTAAGTATSGQPVETVAS
jgi:predicted ATPase/class 3 adenylate cyclase